MCLLSLLHKHFYSLLLKQIFYCIERRCCTIAFPFICLLLLFFLNLTLTFISLLYLSQKNFWCSEVRCWLGNIVCNFHTVASLKGNVKNTESFIFKIYWNISGRTGSFFLSFGIWPYSWLVKRDITNDITKAQPKQMQI